jgi:hypothetical protein
MGDISSGNLPPGLDLRAAYDDAKTVLGLLPFGWNAQRAAVAMTVAVWLCEQAADKLEAEHKKHKAPDRNCPACLHRFAPPEAA